MEHFPSAGLDNIPKKLIKIAAEVVAPSLTEILIQFINSWNISYEGKEARVSPLYKNGAKMIQATTAKYRSFLLFQKLTKKIYDQLYDYLSTNNLLTCCQSGFR